MSLRNETCQLLIQIVRNGTYKGTDLETIIQIIEELEKEMNNSSSKK